MNPNKGRRIFRYATDRMRVQAIRIITEEFGYIYFKNVEDGLRFKQAYDKALGRISGIGDLKGTGLETPYWVDGDWHEK